MSSNIQIKRICQHCNKDFIARTTVTQYCSHRCARLAYKARMRNAKIKTSDHEVQQIKSKPIEEIKSKEFLTVRDVSKLLNCSVRTAYRLIENGTINGVNIAQRKTLVKRSEIDKLFSMPKSFLTEIKDGSNKQIDDNDCYNLSEVQLKYGISEKALQELIKRKSIPKIKKGIFALVPKTEIDKIFN